MRRVQRTAHHCIGFNLIWIVLALASGTTAAATWTEFMVITTDYTTLSSVTAVQRYTPWSARLDLNFVCSDAVARYHDGFYYVVERGNCNSIHVLDPADEYQTVQQFSLGANLNLQDIAFRSDGVAFVSCYDSAVLLKVDVETGIVLDTFSTASFADADGLPETGWMLARDDLLYITCQLLDRDNWYLPTGPGRLLVFNMQTETWIDASPGTPGIDGIALMGANPYTQLELSADRSTLRVGCNGVYGLLDGGVEAVDLLTRMSYGFDVTESALGGDVIDCVTVAADRAFAIVSDPSFVTSLVTYNPQNGAEITAVALSDQYAYADIAFDGADLLYLADRTLGQTGLRVYDVHTHTELTSSPIATGLAPGHIALPRESSLTGLPDAKLAGLHLWAPWPNPANPGSHIRFRGPSLASLPLRIFDVRGRLILSRQVRTDASGFGVYHFPGRDETGRPVASGVYRVMVGEGHSAATQGLTLVR